jgi:hypothetical protein
MSYTYPTIEIAKVPGHKPSEPAILKLFEAIRIRDEREKSYNRRSLTDHQREEYLVSIQEELQIRSQAFKYQIYEIGRLLCDAKRILPHGEFKPWIKDNFDFCYKTASNFMKVYRVCIGHPEVVKYFNQSCLYVIARPDFPSDLREALFNGVKGPVDIKEKDLVRIALDYKNGKIQTTDPEVQNILKRHMDISRWEKIKIELEALKILIANRLAKIEGLSRIHTASPLIVDGDIGDQSSSKDEQDKIVGLIKKHIAEIDAVLIEVGEKCK